MKLIDAIKQRHSVKLFDPNVKIPHAEMQNMLQLAMLAPSSINLQPWRFVVVESPEAKAKLKGLVMFNETQLETSAAMVLVLADLQSITLSNTILQQSIDEGLMPPDIADYFRNSIEQAKQNLPASAFRDQALMDTNLAAMQFMLIAKHYGYETNAIGGFDKVKVLEVLEVDAKRYFPVMLIAIGKGAKPHRPSSRLSPEHTISWNNGKAFKV